MEKNEHKKHMTIKELMGLAVERARKDPLFAEAEKLCELDYDSIAYGPEETELCRCEFDVISYAAFGGSEGIYGTVQLQGCWAPAGAGMIWNSRISAYTLKTLSTSKEAYIGISMMGNLIAYHATDIIMENLKRFD